MSVATAVPSEISPTSVRTAVAAFLQVAPAAIEAGTPLTAYRIGSLGALELVASLEDRFECRLPESLLADCPDLERLTSALNQQMSNGNDCTFDPSFDAGLDRMLADARLPDDVRPLDARPSALTNSGPVFLTGATGFLGAALLRDLIDAGTEVVCLVRSAGELPASRVHDNLRRYSLWRESDACRIR